LWGNFGERFRYLPIHIAIICQWIAPAHSQLKSYEIGAFKLKISYLPLWKLLLDKRMTKTELRKLADISTTTLTKLSKDQSVGMDMMARICTALNCDIADIVVMVPDENADKNEGENGG